jgi:hypothetical protein
MRSWLKGGIIFLGYTILLALILFFSGFNIASQDLLSFFVSFVGISILFPGIILYSFVLFIFTYFSFIIIFFLSLIFPSSGGLFLRFFLDFSVLLSWIFVIFFMGSFLMWIYERSQNRAWLRGGLFGYLIGGIIIYLIQGIFLFRGCSGSVDFACVSEFIYNFTYIYYLGPILFLICGALIGWLIGRSRK